MAPRGRQPGFSMSNEHRDKIKNSNLLNRLLEHSLGNVEMTQTQCTVGLGLLKKIMPDLASVELGGNPDNPMQMIVTGVPRLTDIDSDVTD